MMSILALLYSLFFPFAPQIGPGLMGPGPGVKGYAASSISLVNVSSCVDGTLTDNTPCSITSTTAGSRLVIGFSLASGTVVSVTDSAANSATSTGASIATQCYVYTIASVGAGVNSVTIDNNSGAAMYVTVWEISGSTGIDQAQSATFAYDNNPVGVSVTTTQASEVVVAVLSWGGTVTGMYSGNPFTSDAIGPSGRRGFAHYSPTTTGTYTPRWASSSGGSVSGACTASIY